MMEKNQIKAISRLVQVKFILSPRNCWIAAEESGVGRDIESS